MDWKDVGKLIAPLAPQVGSILGGFIPFPGGSLIGQKLGEILASAFGVAPTPDAVGNAIANTPEAVAIAKINAAVQQARIEIDGFVAMENAYYATVQKSIEQTTIAMEHEAEARARGEHWFFSGWRPCSGWVLVFQMALFGTMLNVAALLAILEVNSRPLQILSDAWVIFLAYFGASAMLNGIYIGARSYEKGKAIVTGGLAAPSPTAPPKKK